MTPLLSTDGDDVPPEDIMEPEYQTGNHKRWSMWLPRPPSITGWW